MNPEVWVTGMGVISAIGIGPEETFVSLTNQHSGILPYNHVSPTLGHIPVAAVGLSDQEILRSGRIIPPDAPLSRTAALGLFAATNALRHSGWEGKDLRAMRIVGATTVSGMNLAEMFLIQNEERGPLACVVPTFDCADPSEMIAHYYEFQQATTLCTACSSSANAMITGTRMILNNLCDKVIVGGSDSLSRFTLHGFNALELLSSTGCKPFDASRNGITIGEGSAYLVLESSRTADKSKALARISGYANRNESYHATASSPDGKGAATTMAEALRCAGLEPEDIGYINAHGTGTTINDLSEGKAIETIFGSHIPLVSSTKGFTGHTLGAAGAIEAVISVLALNRQTAFPNAGFSEQMTELSFSPVRAPIQVPLRHVLSNSFGFGGNNSSLIFSLL